MKLKNLPPVYEAYSAEYPDLTVCRIVLQEKELYHVIHKYGMMQAQVSGKFRYDVKTVSDFPAVGDYVMADITGGDRAVIHNVLPRTSVFIRKAAGKSNTEQVVAANIDTVFLCMSLNNDFNIRRIEGLSAMCRFKNCTHKSEPGCAVQAAIKNGELSEERLSSYEKLKIENAYSEDAEGYLAAKEEKFKKIAKYNKANHKK